MDAVAPEDVAGTPARSDRTLLCLARIRAGRLFTEEAARLGCRVVVLTEDGSAHAPFAGAARVVSVHAMDDPHAVWCAVRDSGERPDRVVAMLEKEVGPAAALRAGLGLPGISVEVANRFRDKLAMRMTGLSCDVLMPHFVAAADRQAVHAFLETTPPPYVVKIRDGLGASDIRRIEAREHLIPTLDALGDRVDRYLVEQFVPGTVYHVDSVVCGGQVAFASVSRYGTPLLDVVKGGNFVSFTIARGTPTERALQEANRKIVAGFGLDRGVTHIEYIEDAQGRIHLLEAACRLAASRLPWVIDAARGVCLYREWARLEAFDAFTPTPPRDGYAGVVTTVARRGPVDLAGWSDPMIVWRSRDPYVPSVIVRGDDPEVVAAKVAEIDRTFTEIA